jgi:hypothetical protein
MHAWPTNKIGLRPKKKLGTIAKMAAAKFIVPKA